VVTRVLLLFGSGLSCEGDLQNSEEAFFANGEESLLFGLIDINNLSLSNVNDLVKALDLSSDDLSDPESFVHQPLCSLNGHEFFPFTKEESESSGYILA
jgi:hypothetical protein